MRKNKLIVSAMFLTILSGIASATELESKSAEVIQFCILGFCFGSNQDSSSPSSGNGGGLKPPTASATADTQTSRGNGGGLKPPKE